ncbi:MAG: ADP-ribosylglycohydrolase family protein [Gammaproteobacteria bacterium]|nr:ADP-ribosylglycohydrolase family protein [Gammaproteobacteria bacterium]
MRRLFSALTIMALCGSMTAQADVLTLSRSEYSEKLHGFWLGQCIANWTGILTEMDKIGGDGDRGVFYTREDWGTTVQSKRWGGRSWEKTIDWVRQGPDEIWGADDDTDIEYMYQYLLTNNATTRLTGEQIRDGWIKHIYDEKKAPRGENFLWVSNQRAHDLMLAGMVPPATSDPANNQHYEMIDAQLTTEIFGLYAPGRPDIALEIAHLPIRTTASAEAALASEFYVIMHALAAAADPAAPSKAQVHALAALARSYLPDESTTAKMYDFVKQRYEAGVPWEEARDDVYRRYQVEQKDGYDKAPRNPVASGINFAASMVSLFFGEGDYQETVKIAVLAGWDSDNPAATWGGLLGFMIGKQGVEEAFGQEFSDRYHIHRTRTGFPVPEGIDNFPAMAAAGVEIVDRVVVDEIKGEVRDDQWMIPLVALPE